MCIMSLRYGFAHSGSAHPAAFDGVETQGEKSLHLLLEPLFLHGFQQNLIHLCCFDFFFLFPMDACLNTLISLGDLDLRREIHASPSCFNCNCNPLSQCVTEGKGCREFFNSAGFPVQVCLCGVGWLPLQFVIWFCASSVITLTTISFQAVSPCFGDNKICCK